MSTGRNATLVGIFFGGVLSALVPQRAMATTLTTQELQLTNNSAFNTTPVGAQDSISPWVVYAQTDTNTTTQGTVWYQRFSPNAVVGSPVEISTGSTTDQLDDTDGAHIVYTAYSTTSTLAGSINLYDLATQTITTVATANSIYSARVSGDNVVWLQGTFGAVSLMLANVSTTPATTMVVAGPTPTVSSADVGSRFVVYEVVVNGQRDVMAYDLQQNITVPVANDPNINERVPHTSGAWVVWAVQATGYTAVRAKNMDTQQVVTVVQSSANNAAPTIDGNMIAYQSNPNGVANVYVYRIPTGDTFQVTNNPNDEQLNDVFGNQVTYVDNRGGQYNVYVTTLTFTDAANNANNLNTSGGGDGNTTTSTGNGNTTSTGSDPNASNPNASNPNTANPNSTDPNASNPNTGDPNASDPNASDPNASDPNGGTPWPPPPPPLGDPNTANPNTPPVVINPNTANPNTGGDPNSGDPNASNPNTTDPNGYHGGCGHHWCEHHGHEPHLSVWRRHGQTQVDVGFCRAIPLEVPYSLPATDHCDSGTRTAYLMFQDSQEHLTVCTYQRQAGHNGNRPYALVSCTNKVRAGQVVWVNYVDLRWEMGDHDREEAGATLSLDLRDFGRR